MNRIWSLSIETEFVTVRLLVIRLAVPAPPVAMLELSRSIFSLIDFTEPPEAIDGVMPSLRPTSLRSMVWNGLTAPLLPPPPVFEKLPVRNGTSWPALNLASSLSSVVSCGVERILVSPSLASARSSTAKNEPPLVKPPAAAVAPWPISVAAAAISVEVLVPVVAVVVVVPREPAAVASPLTALNVL